MSVILTPWLTTDDLVKIIKQRIMIPASQQAFTDDDITDCINNELFDSQVPSVLMAHEEFFVTSLTVPLQTNLNRYPIPDRAIGMRLRDIFYQDSNGNLTKLSRINPDNKDVYQNNNVAMSLPYTFFIEGNDIVFNVFNTSTMTGSLLLNFFLRPNKLTSNKNAFIISSFGKQVTVSNASLAPGDTLTITTPAGVSTLFTAVSGVPGTNQFQIGASSIATASNLVTALNTNGTVSASNGTVATNLVQLTYPQRGYTIISSNSTGLGVSSLLTLNSSSTVPTTITNNSYVDFLQTKPGHRIYSYDVQLGATAVSGSSLNVTDSNVPTNIIVGDYVCAQYSCIIPQLPPELHSLLAERACSRILSAQGDQEGLQDSKQKIAEMSSSQSALINNRVEGSPEKVINRFSHLNNNQFRIRTIF